jgi:ATP-binding cassette subfamily B protein
MAVIGKTGSGKSTLANLLCRLYDADDGSILIDGRDIRTLNINSLRSQIGYVPQDVFLFSDTIAANIGFSVSETGQKGMAAIHQAARDAAIYQGVMEFPKQFHTVVGERGITLSGGQKQRISIARAIIREPKILIFDDCLSAVDAETEEEILGNLKRIMKGKTSIVISHRVSSVKSADKILVMENGSIAEEGKHDELLAKNGLYYSLYQMQLLEEAHF